MPAAELGGTATKARQAEREEAQKAPEVVPVDTAFLVYRKTTGEIVMTQDINTPVVPNRPPNLDDVFSMSSVIVKDLNAQTVVGVLQQLGAAAAQAQAAAPMTEEVVRKLRAEGVIK